MTGQAALAVGGPPSGVPALGYAFCFLLPVLLALATPGGVLGDYLFTNFDVPQSLHTFAYGIDDTGQTVGTYIDAFGVHGFLRSADGSTYTTFDHPNGIGTTQPSDINSDGLIVGIYQDSPVPPVHGFVRSADGSTYTTIDHPNAIHITQPNGINDAGQVVGSYDDVSGNHGFVLSADGSTYTTIDILPGDTGATGINAAGLIVGSSGGHGFVRSADGSSYTTFDVPGSAITTAWGINTDGQIVGSYNDGLRAHGFLRSEDGSSYTNIDDPDGVVTLAYRINDAGQIVGTTKTVLVKITGS